MIGFRRQIKGKTILIVKILFIVLLISLFMLYNDSYTEGILEQNMSNISNLNQSAGELASKYFESQQNSLNNLAQYTARHRLSTDGLLNFFYDANADENAVFELIGTDYTGYCIRKDENGDFVKLSYKNGEYDAMHKIFNGIVSTGIGGVNFMPEFTDDYSATKCFALYVPLTAYESDGTVTPYTLMMVSASSSFIDMVQLSGNYDGMSTVLLDGSGNYIISNSNFKSDNFFQFLYTTNDLSLDEKNALRDSVISSENGICFYNDSHAQYCAYAFRRMNDGGWFIVSCVPLTSFMTQNTDYNFTLLAIALVLLVFIIDLLWLRGLNKRLKTSMEKERSANNAKTDFLSRMSHDIRTPLNAVIGFSGLVMEESSLSPTAVDSLQKINSSGKYLLGLINDILDMTKIESNKIELNETLINAPDFVNDIAIVFAAQAKQKNIALVTDFALEPETWVYMDKLRMRQVYSNLLNNSIKFSDAGTTITWSITSQARSADTVEIISIISDQGCGMSPEFMRNLFQPFVQERNSHTDREGGTGLGLSIVKRLVELMGGTISVESALGKGSSFTIRIIRKKGEMPAVTPEAPAGDIPVPEKKSMMSGKCVLLCEDHPLNREIAVRLLTKQHITVETAENGQLGLDIFTRSVKGHFDAILMDIRMPVMDGLETTRAIRASAHPDALSVPIIAMTANAFSDDIQACIDAGMNDHVAKPVDPEKLFGALAKYLGAPK